MSTSSSSFLSCIHQVLQEPFDHLLGQWLILRRSWVEDQHAEVWEAVNVAVEVCHGVREFLLSRVELSENLLENLGEPGDGGLHGGKVIEGPGLTIFWLNQENCVRVLRVDGWSRRRRHV
jgi:hypothetical protein